MLSSGARSDSTAVCCVVPFSEARNHHTISYAHPCSDDAPATTLLVLSNRVILSLLKVDKDTADDVYVCDMQVMCP